jgi:hypothetical protein
MENRSFISLKVQPIGLLLLRRSAQNDITPLNVIEARPVQSNIYLHEYNQPVAVTAAPALHR